MNKVKMNSGELKETLKYIISNNRKLQTVGKRPITVSICGAAGLGKTSVVEQLAEELDLKHFEVINLAQLDELGDLVGIPMKEYYMTKTANEKTVGKWIEDKVIDTYAKQGYTLTNNSRMGYSKPAWIAGKGENGVLVLDDYTRAQPRFMQAVMEIINKQEYISWKLPKNWTILLTENPDDGTYNVTDIDAAAKSRYMTFDIKWEVDVWAEWAEQNKIDQRCINFMLMHPELVTQRVNPRSITTFFNGISSIPKFEESLPLIQMIGEGSVGVDFSSMFTMFINNKLDKIISPEDTLTKDEAYVMGALSNAVGRDDDFRADISSVIATRLINYSLVFANTKPVPAAMTQRLIKLTTDCDAFTDDLRYYIIKEIVNGNKVKFAPLMQNKDVVKMAVK